MMATLEDGDLRLEFLDFAPHPVHRAPCWRFRMVDAPGGEELGRINLRTGRTPHIERYAGHVGYAVDPPHRGHHYAARSLRLLLPLARELGFDTLWITCDPENTASRRTAEAAGAEFVEIVDVPEDNVIHQAGHPRKCRYRFTLQNASADHVAPDRVIHHQEDNGADHRHCNAVKIDPGDSRIAQQMRQPAADGGPHDAQQDIEHHSLAAMIHQMAGDESGQ